MAQLALSDDEVRRLAEELAPLLAVALSARESTQPGWMDSKSAAQYGGCSVHSLRRAMAAREVRFTQDSPGGKAWFKAEWIDAWRGI